ncbi:MAG TPA: hypothetical protein GX503_01350, partial [Clostridiales bacterium]|nr:hypothetical protein [Clostridiales bacterium]
MNERNEIIRIDNDVIEDRAIKYFSKMYGLDREKEKYQKMFEHAMMIRDKILDKINIRILIDSFEGEDLCGKMLLLNGIEFYCNAF